MSSPAELALELSRRVSVTLLRRVAQNLQTLLDEHPDGDPVLAIRELASDLAVGEFESMQFLRAAMRAAASEPDPCQTS